MTVAGQPTVNYSYDAAGLLSAIQTMINGSAAAFNVQYDPIGRRTSSSLPNGVTTIHSYDNAGRLLSLTHLDAINVILESLNYTYDAAGNRTSMNRPAVNLPLPNPANNTSFNQANQMLTYNDKTMIYDANGNMTSVANTCGTTNYTWDVRNRLSGINGFNTDCSPFTASFNYDALGRRIGKTINSRTIQYLYDGPDIVQEIEGGSVSANYIRTRNIDEPLTRIESNGTVRHYMKDALGSIIALTDDTGDLTTTYAYDPFGDATVTGEVSDNPFQYTGRENDGTGIYYYRARYYSPELQRFISKDPIGLKGGLNLYVYAANNPVRFIDPDGNLSVFAGEDCTNTSSKCDEYSDCYKYSGANAKCFCKCAGNDAWSQIVRCCLRQKYNEGYSGNLAHTICYGIATALAGPPPVGVLADCYFKCSKEQKEQCPPCLK